MGEPSRASELDSLKKGRGSYSDWYDDDQVLAANSTPGARAARQERVALLTSAFSAWRPKLESNQAIVGLDAGCGDGINLSLLHSLLELHCSEPQVLGLDNWGGRLRKASNSPAAITAGDICELPLLDSSIDIMLLSHVVEHVEDPEKVLEEAVRVVRPGGLIVVAVPNEGCFMAQVRNNLLQRSILRTTDHVQFFTMRSLKRLVRRVSGLEVLWAGREGFFAPHLAINLRLRERRYGRGVLVALRNVLPSQSAGLAVALRVLPKVA